MNDRRIEEKNVRWNCKRGSMWCKRDNNNKKQWQQNENGTEKEILLEFREKLHF